MKVEKGKSYTVKDWFGNKVAEELQKNIIYIRVFAILKETEKAIYAMLDCGTFIKKTMWVPKSVLVVIEEDRRETYDMTSYENNYEMACEYIKRDWKEDM